MGEKTGMEGTTAMLSYLSMESKGVGLREGENRVSGDYGGWDERITLGKVLIMGVQNAT